MKKIFIIYILLCLSCGKEDIILSNYLKRISDAVLVPCDPYNKGKTHSCLIASRSHEDDLVVFDATAREMVLGDIGFPLLIKVPSSAKLAQVKNAVVALSTSNNKLYFIRTFPDKNHKSFATPPKEYEIKEPNSYQMAAYPIDDNNLGVLISHPKSISRIIFDAKNFKLKSKENKKLGQIPSHIAITNDKKFAIVTDEVVEKKLYKIDLKDFTIKELEVKIDTPTQKIFMGKDNKALIFSYPPKHIYLLDINKNTREKYTPKQQPFSAYIGKDGILLANIIGQLEFLDSSLKEKPPTIDLKDEKHLDLESLLVAKLIGGKILEDSSIKGKSRCQDQIFILTSYASQDGTESESNSYLCEGKNDIHGLLD